MIVVVFGVAASGKSTLGKALAAALGWPFVEGDDFLAEMDWSDPRLPSRMRFRVNAEAVPGTEPDGSGGAVRMGWAVRLEGPGGSWSGTGNGLAGAVVAPADMAALACVAGAVVAAMAGGVCEGSQVVREAVVLLAIVSTIWGVTAAQGSLPCAPGTTSSPVMRWTRLPV